VSVTRAAAAPAQGAAALPAILVDRRRSRRRAAWRRRRLVLLLMSPWIVGFSVFFGYPLVMSAYLSFTHYDLITSPHWIGLANYRYMLQDDPLFWGAVKNTLWLVAFMVPAQVLFAFGIALMLSRARQGAGFFRTVFYLPALVPPVAATLGFVYILNPANGPVNTILAHLGVSGPLWFQSPHWSKPSLTLLSMWAVGNVMVIFLAAILDVPRQLYESAQLDGAGPLQRLRWVILPSISPVILFAVIIGVIQALQYFTQAYVAWNIAGGQASQAGSVSTVELGYPEGSTLMYPILLYQHGFRYFHMGYASAMAMLMLGVAFVLTAIILRNSRRWVHYAGAAR
jgi:multiple sugar transport system permease protein